VNRGFFLLLAFATVMLPAMWVSGKDYSPLKIEGTFDYINDADFKDSAISTQHMNYAQSSAEVTYTQPLCEEFGLLISGGFKSTHIDWAMNPSFKEKDFYYYNVGLGAYTLAVADWTWILKGRVHADVEVAHSDYMLFEGLLWGKHKYYCHCFCDMNLHFGLIGDSGQEKTLILPIIGVDFLATKCLKVGMVFPMDLSISYLFNDCFSVSSAVRFFYRRHRLDNDEPEPRGVIQYRNMGVEAGLTYKHPCGFYANAHAGWTLEGDLKIANKDGHNSSHYKTEGAVYIGGEVAYEF